MNALVTFEHARRTVLTAARVTPPEAVPLAQAAGRTLATPILGGPLPPTDTSAMDGLAVRVADLAERPARLPVVGTVHAGDPPPAGLEPGTAVAVMTGAPIPPGTEAIAPVEWTRRDGDHVLIERAPAAGQYLRLRGGALPAGTTVLNAGAIVTAGAIGLLASVGAHQVDVRRQPVVSIVSTGDELVDVADTPAPGQIRDANGPGLAAQVEAAGGVAVRQRARDTQASLHAVLDASAEADLLLLAGGVSMGERDLVADVLAERGVQWAFHGVRQRPGKPLAFGTWDGRPVLALPGNPVSAAVGFEVYGHSLLAGCLGQDDLDQTIPATLDESIAKPSGLTTFARVTARHDEKGSLRLSAAGAQDSHAALSLIASDGIAHLPADWDEAPAGATVRFQPWSWR